MSLEFKHIVYINGVAHRTTGISGKFYADTRQMPGRPCSQHNIGNNTLRPGERLKTSGNWYSLHEDVEAASDPKNDKLCVADHLPPKKEVVLPSQEQITAAQLEFEEWFCVKLGLDISSKDSEVIAKAILIAALNVEKK